ncbi:hypothetical protein OAL15_03810 [Flavobacteriales bacterium]|nr:hypothetical protein [Flavobacteriales bacterium]
MAKGLKTGGREKGTPNRTTKEAREVLLSILEQYQDNGLEKDLEAVKPEARLKFMADLMKHLIPKPKAQEEKEQTKPSKIEVVIRNPKEANP